MRSFCFRDVAEAPLARGASRAQTAQAQPLPGDVVAGAGGVGQGDAPGLRYAKDVGIHLRELVFSCIVVYHFQRLNSDSLRRRFVSQHDLHSFDNFL